METPTKEVHQKETIVQGTNHYDLSIAQELASNAKGATAHDAAIAKMELEYRKEKEEYQREASARFWEKNGKVVYGFLSICVAAIATVVISANKGD